MKIRNNYEKVLKEDYSDLSAREIYNKGTENGPNFDYKKGLEELINKDRVGIWIYNAGRNWKRFDYKKGFDALIQIDDSGYYIYYAGRDWGQFDYKKGLAQLKKISPNEWHRIAKEKWPLSGKETLDKISDELKNTPHRKDKKLKLEATEIDYSELSAYRINIKEKKDPNFDYKKGLGALIQKDKDGRYIYYAGEGWKQFDFDKGLDALIQIDKDGKYIFYAGMDWKQFDFEKGLAHLKKISPYYYKKTKKKWPPSAKETLDKISDELSKTPQRPSRKLKLENMNEQYNYIAAQDLYDRGNDDPNFDFNKGLDDLIKLDENGFIIIEAGKDWKQFDFEKGLDAVIKKSNNGKSILEAGKDWKQFDYKKGLNALIKKDKIGIWIYKAGRDWKQFDCKKGFKQLKKISPNEWYKEAKKYWPPSAKETLDKISDELSKTPQRPSKKMKLENTEEDYENLRINKIIDKGAFDPNFDFEKGLDALIKRSKKAEDIYLAGIDWREFNYKKGLDTLIQIDRDGEWIYHAGREWKQFDYKKGLDALIKIDKDGRYIYLAGVNWKQFDYKKGFELLKKISPDKYYKKAKKDWPPSAKDVLDKISDELKSIPQRPSKKMRLK